jgi:hypothetical protein
VSSFASTSIAPRKRDHLLDGDRAGGELPRRIKVQLQLRERLLRALHNRAPPNLAKIRRLTSKADVFRDREMSPLPAKEVARMPLSWN